MTTRPTLGLSGLTYCGIPVTKNPYEELPIEDGKVTRVKFSSFLTEKARSLKFESVTHPVAASSTIYVVMRKVMAVGFAILMLGTLFAMPLALAVPIANQCKGEICRRGVEVGEAREPSLLDFRGEEGLQTLEEKKISTLDLLLPKSFIGRHREFKELHEAFQRQRRVVITGLGGSGKTSLVLKYLQEYQSDYQFVHFVQGGSSQLITQGLLQLADDLNLPQLDTVESRLGLLKRTLEHFQQDYLLVFDGIGSLKTFQALENYLPARGHCLIVTGKMPKPALISGFKVQELHPLPMEDAVNYLQLVAGSQEEGARALADKLGRLPLALTQAAQYIRRQKIDFQTYLREFNQKVERAQNLSLSLEEKIVLGTSSMCLEAIEQQSRGRVAHELLAFTAFLGQGPIHLDLIEGWFEPQTSQEWAPILGCLLDYGMMVRTGSHAYEMPLLVQRAIRSHLSQEKQHQVFKRAIAVFNSLLLRYHREEKAIWNPTKSAIFHAKALLGREDLMSRVDLGEIYQFKLILGSIYGKMGNLQEALELLTTALRIAQRSNEAYPEHEDSRAFLAASYTNIGDVQFKLGEAQEGLSSYQKALDIWRHLKGGNHHLAATSYGNVAKAQQALGQIQEELNSHQKALKIWRHVFGENHAEVALSYSNMGGALQTLGRLEEGLKFFHKALKVQLDLYGENHDQVATSYNNIGTVLNHLWKAEEGLHFHQKAFNIWHYLNGAYDPSVALSYSNMGVSYHTLGNMKKGLECFQQALQIQLHLYGENHPDLIETYLKVGTLQFSQENLQKALHFLQKALQLQLDHRGDKHPYAATIYNQIGSCQHKLGKTQEGLDTLFRALEIQRDYYSEDHPDLALTYHSIGAMLPALGRAEEGTEYCLKAIKILLKHQGDTYLPLAAIYSNLGDAQRHLGKYQESLESYQKALKIMLSHYEETHPDVAVVYYNFGTAQLESGHAQKALELYQKAVEIWLDHDETSHLHLANGYSGMGKAYHHLGKVQKGLEFYQKALKLQLSLYEENHPDIATSYDNIGTAQRDLGKAQEALNFHRKALEMRLNLYGENHGEVAGTYISIGNDLIFLKKKEEAIKANQKALDILIALRGPVHPDVQKSEEILRLLSKA